MAILQILGGILMLTGVWWMFQNLWIFPSWHDHGEARGCGRIKILPSPWAVPFGIDKLLKSLRAERTFRLPLLMVEDHELYGDTYAQYAGFQFIIITCDPRNTSSVLVDQFSKFGFGPTRKISFGPLLGDGIFTADGSAWSASRRLLAGLLKQPKFAPLHTMESHLQDLLRSVTARMEKSSQVDLQPLFFDYTLDTATGLFLGNSSSLLSEVDTPDHQGRRFSTNFNKAITWIATRERFKNFGWVVVPPSLVQSCRNARDALKNMIIEAEQLEKDGAFGSFLAKSTDHDKARDELMNLLFAARDSNASLLSWATYSLAREPRARETLHREIVAIMGPDPDKQPSVADLNAMTYLDHVISETLRLFPPAPMSGRICDETTTLPVGGGPSGEDPVYVPKGTVICFQIYPCHRSQKHYGEDAMDFRPERWEQVDVKTRTKDYTFHPFIGGPRKCLGELFAMKLAKYTLCRLMQNYDFETVGSEGRDWQRRVKYRIGLTSGPEDGVLVNITARKRAKVY